MLLPRLLYSLLQAGVGGESATALLAAWQRQGPTLTAALASRAALPSCALIDASWRFGVTIATQDVQRAGATYVQLRLLLAPPDGGPSRNEVVELSLPQFYGFLATLEKASSYVAFLSGNSGTGEVAA